MEPVVEFDLSKFNVDMAKIPVVLAKAIRTGIKYQLVEIQKLAMRKHRHITRSGSLNSSIQTQMNNDFEGQVHFDTGIAAHGVFVHEGHGASGKSVTKGYPYVWKPDRFLYEALAAREATIKADLEATINSGLATAGLL
jgi:hypothetical protein